MNVSEKLSKPAWLTLGSALLIVLAFPPWDLSFLIWVCLVPWLLALERCKTPREAFLQGVWLSFLMSIGGFTWVAAAIHEFGGVPWPLSVLALFLFGLFGQPQFFVWGPFLGFFSRRMPGIWTGTPFGLVFAVLTSALLYVGIDALLPKIFADTLGHALYKAVRIRQLADLGGPHLLTLLVMLTNLTLWLVTSRWLKRRGERGEQGRLAAADWRPLVPTTVMTLAATAGAWAYGHYRVQEVEAIIAKPLVTFNAAVIQGNIGDFDKIAAENGISGAADKVLDTLLGLSQQALERTPKVDAIVWPETSYPSTFRTPQTADELAHDQRVERFVKTQGIPLLFGGYDHWYFKDYNSFFFLSPEARWKTPEGEPTDLQIYHKSVLLLFGEYIPGYQHLKLLRDWFPQVGNFGRGPGPMVLTVPVPRAPGGLVSAGPIICYEALFPDYIIGAARKGSQLILNITNDSWFGPLQEPYLHLALTTFRSIETRLPQLRSTNTGISTLITATGEITQPTKLGEATVLQAQVPITAPIPTLMKRWGDWFGKTALVAGLLLLGGLYLSSRKGRPRTG